MSLPGTRILKFLIIESGAYHEQWRHTYKTDWGGDVQQILDEKLAGLQEFTPSNVAGVANHFLKVDSAPEKQVIIHGGMGSRRFRFMLMMEIVDLTGFRTVSVATGYSDSVDVSNGATNFGINTTSNQINPDMPFTINSIMQVKEHVEHTALGRQTFRTMVDNSHLLFDKHSRGMASNVREDFVRPEDVFSVMSLNQVPGSVSRNSYDARTVMSARPVKSRRSNTVAANYMARVMESHNVAWLSHQLGENEDKSLYGTALGNAAEASAATDPLLSAIKQIRGKQSVDGLFTLRDIEKIDPAGMNDRNRTRTAMLTATERSVTDTRQSSSPWGHSTLENQWALILGQAVPAILTDLALLGISFKASNRTHFDRKHVVGIDGHMGLEENVDLSMNLLRFEQRLVNEVLPGLSRNNLIDYDIEMFVDILNELRIKISIQGKPAIPFNSPTFCDALTVPNITGIRDNVVTIADDFEQMHNRIISNTSDRLPLNFNVSASY